MGKQIVPIIVFGFDYNAGKTAAGYGTKLRCMQAVALSEGLRKAGKTPLYIVSSGRAPGVTPKAQPRTMAWMMVDALRSCGADPAHIRIGRQAWGTRGELIEGVRVIKRHLSMGLDVREACLVSNPLHAHLRIRVLAGAMKISSALPWKWRIVACAWRIPAWGARARAKELGKFGVELVRAWFSPPAL